MIMDICGLRKLRPKQRKERGHRPRQGVFGYNSILLRPACTPSYW
ncbi:hypothetical protein OROMI_015674 [Orobanche minor]